MFAMLRAIDDVYRAFRFTILRTEAGERTEKMEKCFNEAIVTHTQGMRGTALRDCYQIKFEAVSQPEPASIALTGRFHPFHKSKSFFFSHPNEKSEALLEK